jgi:hypothetical protein
MLLSYKSLKTLLTPLLILVLCSSAFAQRLPNPRETQSTKDAQEDCCRGNILKNGNFSSFNIAGTSNFPPSTVTKWDRAFGTPQIASSPLAPGCDGKPGFTMMWGNRVVGEAIRQTNVQIQPGRIYRVSACVRVDTSNPVLPKYVRFNVRASVGPLSSYTVTGPLPTVTTIGMIGDATNTPVSSPQGIVSTQWTSVTLPDWTAPAAFDTITINPENDSTRNDGNTVSWGHLDNFCIQEVRRGGSDGDPHLSTVDGVRYDFQSGGEFVLLRDGNGLEIQTRQTPVSAHSPVANAYTGLSNCVSVNTAFAARVGGHRVTFQQGLNGVPNSSGLQLRVDGALTTIGAGGLTLSGGGHIKSLSGGGVQVDFPDGTTLLATPGWWAAQNLWYLNLRVVNTLAANGLIGEISPGGWLPALPNGSSLGPKPTSLHQRYVDLYQTFADAWRVTDSDSLFDYASGTSTATFTDRSWPAENGSCGRTSGGSVRPIEMNVARQACRVVLSNQDANTDCVFDVVATGELGFAKTYLLAEQTWASFWQTKRRPR